MFFFTSRSCATAMAFAISTSTLGTGAAMADITPADVWGDWRTYMQNMGYSISGTETTAGGTLTVSDIRIGMDFGDAAEDVTMTLGSISFAPTGDGAVDVQMPGSMPVSLAFVPAGEDPVRLSMTYAQSGQSLIVSGAPEDMTYAYGAETLSATLNEVQADGITLGPDQARVVVTAKDVASTTKMTIGDLRSYLQTVTMGSLTYDVLFTPPDEPDSRMKMQGALNGLGFNGTSSIPHGDFEPDDMAKLLSAGFAFDAAFTYANGEAAMDFQDPDDGMQTTSKSGAGQLNISMSEAGLAYSGTATDASMTGKAADFPFPVSFEAAEYGFKMAIPVKSSEAEQDFQLGITISDFAVSDVIWGLFDPAGQLPRDPATIDLDLSGKAQLLLDYLDPAKAAEFVDSGVQPGRLKALAINRLLVDMVGAKLSGTGDFTFDYNDLVTFEGMPRPTGKLDLQLVGGNGLLDKLVAMGFVGNEEAMGARMMMGMFAVPTDTPDTLKSTLEINDQGHITANGQRIQ